MISEKFRLALTAAALAVASLAIAADDPRIARHEIMEGVGEAAKPVGQMLKGEIGFDADVLMESFMTFRDAGKNFGGLFPAGSETGEGTEAAPAIWEDRAGFDEALTAFQNAVEDAIAAEPASIDAAKGAAGPVFKTCKGCHDTYRIEDE